MMEDNMTNAVILDDYVLVDDENETTSSTTSEEDDFVIVTEGDHFSNEAASTSDDSVAAKDHLPSLCYTPPPAPPNSPSLKPQTPSRCVRQKFQLPPPKTPICQPLVPKEGTQVRQHVREAVRDDYNEDYLYEELDRLMAESLAAIAAKPLSYWAAKKRMAFDEVIFDIEGTKRSSNLLTGPKDDTIGGKKAPCEREEDELVSSMEVKLGRSVIGTTTSAGKYDRHMDSKGAKLMSLWLD
jgi:hypothetical protein